MQHDRPPEFDAMLRDNMGLLFHCARAWGVSKSDMDDVIQDAVLQILKTWRNYRWEDGTFKGFIKWQLREVLHYRKQRNLSQKRTAIVCGLDMIRDSKLACAPTQDDTLEAAQIVDYLSGSDNGKTLLRYALTDNAGIIGEEMGVTRQAVERRIKMTRTKLRERMAA